MTKEKFDLFFIVSLLSILAIARPFFYPDLSIFNILYSFVPIILLAYFWLFHSERCLLNFVVTFISFFIIIDIRPWFIEWHNHWVTATLALITASSFTFLFKQSQKHDPLDGTFLNWLKIKIPSANNILLFLLDTILTSTILSIIFSIVVQKIRFWFVIAALIICAYHSATAVYFYLYLPNKRRKKKRKKRG